MWLGLCGRLLPRLGVCVLCCVGAVWVIRAVWELCAVWVLRAVWVLCAEWVVCAVSPGEGFCR